MNNENDREDMSIPQKSSGRRRFVRTIGLAVPVVLTVSARSTLAGTCSSVSANASIRLANSHNATGDIGLSCNGLSPTVWANKDPRAFEGANVSFNSIFGSVPPGATTSSRMRAVIRLSGTDDITVFARYIAAAYVNSKMGLVSPSIYKVSDLQSMWAARTAPAVYNPVPGANWNKTDMQNYLATTW